MSIKTINFPSNSVDIYLPKQLVPGHTYKVKFEFANQDPVEFENICQVYNEVNGNGIARIIMGNPNQDIVTRDYNPEFVVMAYRDNKGVSRCRLFANYSNLNVLVTISEIRPLGKIPTQDLSEIYTYDVGKGIITYDLCDIMNIFAQQAGMSMRFFPTEPIISTSGSILN